MKVSILRGGFLIQGLMVLAIVIGLSDVVLGDNAPAQAATVTTPPGAPELQAAMQAVADAKHAWDAVKERLRAIEPDTREFKQAKAALDAARDQWEFATATAGDPATDKDVKEAAEKLVRAQMVVRDVEQQALEAAPEWIAATARLEHANEALATVLADLDANWAYKEQVAAARAEQEQWAAYKAVIAAREEAIRAAEAQRLAADQAQLQATTPEPLTAYSAAVLQQAADEAKAREAAAAQKQRDDEYAQQQLQAQQQADEYARAQQLAQQQADEYTRQQQLAQQKRDEQERRQREDEERSRQHERTRR